MVSSNQTGLFFVNFYATLQRARHYLGILESLAFVVANPAVSRKSRCVAVRNDRPNCADTVEKVRQLEPLEFLRAAGAAGAHTNCARAVGANRPTVRLTSLL